jgi:hypothetical protein
MTIASSKYSISFILASLFSLAVFASCDSEWGGESRFRHRGGGWGGEVCDNDDDWDDDPSTCNGSPDAGVTPGAPDATVVVIAEDATVSSSPDAATSTTTSGKDAGTSAPDAQAAKPDATAPDAAPQCTSDQGCPMGYICSADGRCVLPACGDIHTEAACLARADCIPIYAGMDCTDPQGRMCVAGDVNCTCATYSFAVCARK